MDKVGKLAQSAADTLTELPGAYHKSIAVALLLSRLAYQAPERECFPGAQRDTVDFRTGKPQVVCLVAL